MPGASEVDDNESRRRGDVKLSTRMESKGVYLLGEGFVIEVVGIEGGELGVLYAADRPPGDLCGVAGVETDNDMFGSFARNRTGGSLPFGGRKLFDMVSFPLA